MYEYYHCTNGCKNSNAVSKVHDAVKAELSDFTPTEASRLLYLGIVEKELKEATKSNRDSESQNKASIKKNA